MIADRIFGRSMVSLSRLPIWLRSRDHGMQHWERMEKRIHLVACSTSLFIHGWHHLYTASERLTYFVCIFTYTYLFLIACPSLNTFSLPTFSGFPLSRFKFLKLPYLLADWDRGCRWTVATCGYLTHMPFVAMQHQLVQRHRAVEELRYRSFMKFHTRTWRPEMTTFVGLSAKMASL